MVPPFLQALDSGVKTKTQQPKTLLSDTFQGKRWIQGWWCAKHIPTLRSMYSDWPQALCPFSHEHRWHLPWIEEHWACNITNIGTFILPEQQPLSDCLWNDVALALLLQGSTLQASQRPALTRCSAMQQHWDLGAPKHSQGKSWSTDRGSRQVQHN